MSERVGTSRERALVLGGGGPVGVGWEIGLMAGLAESGVRLADANFIVGTSAGSIAGAKLAGGADLSELLADSAAIFQRGAATSGADQLPQSGLDQLMELMFRSADVDKSPEEIRAEIGQLALRASTIAEEVFVSALAAEFGGQPWPDRYACTAVDAHSGEFVVWDADRDVPLERAIASSCSVPAIYPPVTIDGRRYIDGGMKSAINADLAVGFEKVVVVSVFPLELPPWLDDPRITQMFEREVAGIDAVKASGAAVEVIVPDDEMMMISGMGMNLTDFTRVQPAADAGHRLGKQEAERIRTIW